MSNKYSAEDIQQLQGLDAVKYRLGMYAGNIDNPNQIAVELISNSVDEIAEGYGNMVHVTVDKDGVLIIEDHGRGIPIDNHPTLKKPAIILSLMDLHTGGKMYNDDNTSYKTSIGLNGIGAKLASATCEYMLTEVWRDGKYAKVVIKDRQLISFDVTKNKTNHPSGTKITYKPIDDGTWGTVEFDIPKMKQFIRDFSYFFPIATFEFNCYDKDKKKMDTTIYHAENGLTDMFNYFTKSDTMLTKEPIVIKKDLDGIEDGLEIVFGFTDETMERTHSYCNALKLIDGGTHVQGFKMALTKALNDAGRNIEVFKAKDANLKGQEIFESVVSVISVKMAKPKFENQTKTKLSNNDLVGKVNSICYEFLKNYFADNPKLVVLVVERMLKLRHAKESAKKHRDLIMKDSKKSDFSSSLIGKFSHCSGRDPMKNELIIIEGQSASGNTKQARDSRFQAVYALKGKIINAEKSEMGKILENQEVKDLISIIGTGIQEEFDISKLKFGKIIIGCDADVDGLHITVLLLTLFFKYMPKLIENGHIYSVVGPLYKITTNGHSVYAMTDKQKDEIISKIKTKYSVTRFKGLGELDPKDLHETMIDPKGRTLIQYTIEDRAMVADVMTKLMGLDSSHRKEMLQGEV